MGDALESITQGLSEVISKRTIKWLSGFQRKHLSDESERSGRVMWIF